MNLSQDAPQTLMKMYERYSAFAVDQTRIHSMRKLAQQIANELSLLLMLPAPEQRSSGGNVERFIQENYEIAKGEIVLVSEVYTQYTEWCKTRDYDPKPLIAFGKELLKEPKIKKIRLCINLERAYYYYNLKKIKA